MRVFLVILTLFMASEGARIVEEIILREGHQKNRQQRRFEDRNNQVIQQQEVEIIYEEPGSAKFDSSGEKEIIKEEIVIVKETDLKPVTPNSVHKGLVPQLWPNYTGPVEPPAETVPCNEAWMKCGFREGILDMKLSDEIL